MQGFKRYCKEAYSGNQDANLVGTNVDRMLQLELHHYHKEYSVSWTD